MRRQKIVSKIALAAVAAAVALAATSARAQTVVTGHYQPLFASGLKSGIFPQKRGIILQNSTLFYHATDFRDGDGNKVPDIDELNIWANRIGAVLVPGLKIAGADYGFALAIPLANLAPNPVVVGGVTLDTGIGIGDIAVAPMILGWHLTNVHIQGGYTIFIPVGRFSQGASNNVGKGFWTHMLNAGVTWMPAVDRPWHASVMTRYEIHSSQEGLDLTPGHTLTVEFGVGKKISNSVDIGLVGHLWRQTTDTAGTDAIDPQKYESYGIGAEVQYVIAKKFPMKVRAGADFEARNVSQGIFVVAEFNFPFYW
jgi:hypothetical protein